MTITDLISEFRLIADDTASPYLCSDAELVTYANEAQREACIRGRLIFDDSTEDICRITVVADTHSYDVDPLVLEIPSARFSTDGEVYSDVLPKSRQWLNDNVSDWRESGDTPKYLVLEGNRLRLVPTPSANGTLYLDVYRLPENDMVATPTPTSPEIPAVHHRHLVHWMLHRAYAKRDSDMFSADLSRYYEDRFTKYFGRAVDARQARNQWADRPHHNRSWE